MAVPFKILIEWDSEERVWVSYVPACGELSTYGGTLDEVVTQTREAILGYLEALAKEGLPLPFDPADAERVRAALERRPTAV